MCKEYKIIFERKIRLQSTKRNEYDQERKDWSHPPTRKWSLPQVPREIAEVVSLGTVMWLFNKEERLRCVHQVVKVRWTGLT